MAQGVTLDTGESYPRLAYFPSFLGGGEVHRKCEEAVLTVSTSAFERYTSRLCGIKTEKVEFSVHGGCGTCLG